MVARRRLGPVEAEVEADRAPRVGVRRAFDPQFLLGRQQVGHLQLHRQRQLDAGRVGLGVLVEHLDGAGAPGQVVGRGQHQLVIVDARGPLRGNQLLHQQPRAAEALVGVLQVEQPAVGDGFLLRHHDRGGQHQRFQVGVVGRDVGVDSERGHGLLVVLVQVHAQLHDAHRHLGRVLDDHVRVAGGREGQSQLEGAGSHRLQVQAQRLGGGELVDRDRLAGVEALLVLGVGVELDDGRRSGERRRLGVGRRIDALGGRQVDEGRRGHELLGLAALLVLGELEVVDDHAVLDLHHRLDDVDLLHRHCLGHAGAGQHDIGIARGGERQVEVGETGVGALQVQLQPDLQLGVGDLQPARERRGGAGQVAVKLDAGSVEGQRTSAGVGLAGQRLVDAELHRHRRVPMRRTHRGWRRRLGRDRHAAGRQRRDHHRHGRWVRPQEPDLVGRWHQRRRHHVQHPQYDGRPCGAPLRHHHCDRLRRRRVQVRLARRSADVRGAGGDRGVEVGVGVARGRGPCERRQAAADVGVDAAAQVVEDVDDQGADGRDVDHALRHPATAD
jgi:hypothetical protein